ncbi:cilia- and flagella-associated protein 58-like [Hemibagrus wyckioides]|uniref:cilia- and flagella-associated protein 58-like n=1 Tax=Hemibagrus wyckioides TaxID=337641 RepID=UPI00266D1CF3|nr:cilia- and flagella-associated protein 58-like [Hemibagrus wyckioides]
MNNLELNSLKTVEMIVDFRKDPAPLPSVILCDSRVMSVESFRFLGTTITQELKWEQNIMSLTKKAQQRMYFLRQLKKFLLHSKILVNFYTAIIESILTSPITVWFAGATARDKAKLQCVIHSAEKVIGCSLPSLQELCISRTRRRAAKIAAKPLSSGKRTLSVPPLWQEAPVHQDQDLTPQEQFLPHCSQPAEQVEMLNIKSLIYQNYQKPEIEEQSFTALEKEFQDVLDELVEHGEEWKHMEKFKLKYEKVITALKKSHENEKRLMTRCQALNAEISSSSVQVETALKLSHEDQATIRSLKKEIEKAWEMVDEASEKEKETKETMWNLREQINTLTEIVAERARTAEEETRDSLLKIKEQLTAERDKLLSELVTLRESYETTRTKRYEAEEANMKAKKAISQLQQEVKVHQKECKKETRQKQKLEKDLKELYTDVEAQKEEIEMLNAQCQRGNDEQQRLEQQLHEQKILTEKVSKELEQLQVRNTGLQQEKDQNLLRLEQLTDENSQQAIKLKLEREKVNQMKQEIAKIVKIREATQKKLRLMEDQKLEVEQQRETLKNQITGLEKEMVMAQKQKESDKKKIDELMRENRMLKRNMIKATKVTEQQTHLVKVKEQAKKKLDQDILNYRDEAEKQRKTILQLEKEQDRYIKEAKDLKKKVLSHMEELKVKTMKISKYKKKVAELETNLKQQNNLYDEVRVERHKYRKNLQDAQHEIMDMKDKMNSMSEETGQLTEEIKRKEAALVKEQLEFQRIEKEQEALKAELQKMKQQAQETKEYMDNQKVEVKRLLKVVADADAETALLKKELDQVISERDNLGTQLVRRNDELSVLDEKIKIQQSILKKGEIQYNQRVEDMRVLKLEIINLRREKRVLNKTASNVEKLKQEVSYTQKELLKEQARCQSLQEELENPMNVHRWRRLEASDPDTFELIRRIHCLQWDLISKRKEVEQQDRLLLEKEKLIDKLKDTLARQPGPEAAEKLQICQQTLTKKTKQFMLLSAELNMYKSQAQEYKNEIDRLTGELPDVKKKNFMQKRKEQAKVKEYDGVFYTPQQCLNASRFKGGGFNLQPGNKFV